MNEGAKLLFEEPKTESYSKILICSATQILDNVEC